MRRPFLRSLYLAVIAALCATQPLGVLAEAPNAFEFFQEEAKVVTASRREQSIRDIPMAVDVITAEEIKASGAVNIWDLMRFRVGMDVVDIRSIDGRRGVVSVRGFPREFIPNLQVLLDGRSVYEPISSGVHWDQLPVALSDIDRIEIIRGPSAALYGSGAGLGVINIITRKPTGPTTAAARVLGGNRGMIQSGASLESSVKNFAYRAGYGYRYQDGFPTTTGTDGNDSMQAHQANARTAWQLAEASHLEFFTGGSWEESGFLNGQSIRNDMNQHFQMLKFAQKLGEQSTIEVLSSRSHIVSKTFPGALQEHAQWSDLQYDEEILHRTAWWDNRLNTTYGVNYRNALSESVTIFGGRPQQRLELWSGYLNQSVQLHRTLSLVGGVSWEDSHVGEGGVRTNYQVATLWTPVANHGLRSSYGVAHTVPAIFNAAASNYFSPFVLFEGNPNLKPQTIYSYEIGYRGVALEKHLKIETGYFYTVIKDIDSTVFKSATFFPQPLITISTDNLNRAIARGVETELRYRFNLGHSVYMNHTFEHITDWSGNTGEVTQNTPAHKLNFGGIAALGHGFTGSLNVGFKNNYVITSVGRTQTVPVPSYWRLDARLGYTLNSNFELFMAAQNMASSTHQEFADGLVVPRTYQGGVSIKFGKTSI